MSLFKALPLTLPVLLLPTALFSAEVLIMEASGSFEARNFQFTGPGIHFADVTVPQRGWFRSEVSGSPGIFNGPDGNSTCCHFSSQLDRLSRIVENGQEQAIVLEGFTTTPIETAPVVTSRGALVAQAAVYQARVVGPFAVSFTFGDFLFGDAQSYVARGYFDPSPTVDAGPAIVVEAGQPAQLLATATDPHGDALTYQWSLVEGPGVQLSSATVLQPTFTAPNYTAPTVVRLQLVARDAKSDSLPDTVDVLIYPSGGNIPPLSAAANLITGSFGSAIPLNGTASSDPDGGSLQYSWTQIEGPPARLLDPTAPSTSFSLYEPTQGDVRYTFELVVGDGQDLSAATRVSTTIFGYARNPIPVGPREALIFTGNGGVPEVEQTGSPNPEPAATLEFSSVSVPGPGRLRTEVRGTPALFDGPDQNNPAFHLSSYGSHWDNVGIRLGHTTDIETAPVRTNSFFQTASGGVKKLTVTGPQALSYTFDDFLYGEAQTFEVFVYYRSPGSAPTASAGGAQSANPGRLVRLDGRGSTDPDGDPLRYQWTQTSGPGVRLSNSESAVPLFKTPSLLQPSTLVFTLTVTDVDGNQQTAQTTVNVAAAEPTPTPTATSTAEPTPSPSATPFPSASPTATPQPSPTLPPLLEEPILNILGIEEGGAPFLDVNDDGVLDVSDLLLLLELD